MAPTEQAHTTTYRADSTGPDALTRTDRQKAATAVFTAATAPGPKSPATATSGDSNTGTTAASSRITLPQTQPARQQTPSQVFFTQKAIELMVLLEQPSSGPARVGRVRTIHGRPAGTASTAEELAIDPQLLELHPARTELLK